MKDKTTVISALYSLIIWFFKPIFYSILTALEAFWQGFYVDNKFTYAVFTIVVILALINSCNG